MIVIMIKTDKDNDNVIGNDNNNNNINNGLLDQWGGFPVKLNYLQLKIN